eukprot:6185979-Pleurochrysis_carterae.AAC.2
MRRSLLKAKLKLSQFTSCIMLFNQTSFACEESTLKVRERCVPFACQERVLARARQADKYGRSLQVDKPKSQKGLHFRKLEWTHDGDELGSLQQVDLRTASSCCCKKKAQLLWSWSCSQQQVGSRSWLMWEAVGADMQHWEKGRRAIAAAMHGSLSRLLVAGELQRE